MVKFYIPERGDIAWTNLDPATGHGQKGKRPALVLSPAIFNKMIGFALAAPITSRVRGHVFEVPLNSDFKIKGVVLCQQVKMIDFKARGLSFAEKVPAEVLAEVLGKVRAIIE